MSRAFREVDGSGDRTMVFLDEGCHRFVQRATAKVHSELRHVRELLFN